MSEYSKTLGDVVYKKRKQNKLTQAELAEQIGVTEQTIRKIEHLEGNPQLDVLYPLIRALHIDPMELFYPEQVSTDTAKQQLEILLADCSSEQIEAILPIIKGALEVLKNTSYITVK